MSHIVIITKPSLALETLPALKERYPGRRVVGILDGAVSILGFDLPQDLSMADYPFVSEPRWRPSPERMEKGVTYEITDGRRVTLEADPFQLVRDADAIVCAEGQWWGGAANFDMLMRYAGGDDLARKPHDFLRLSSLKREHVQAQVAAMGTTLDDDFIATRDGGLVKRRFDWCFAVNSQGLIGPIHRETTGRAVAALIGKYGLQLLYAMRDLKPMTINQLVGVLAKWPGTGRHARSGETTIWMGSQISVSEIARDVIRSGLVSARAVVIPDRSKDTYALNDAGRRFLDGLHPDCRDPDLPWRIRAWQEGGTASEEKVDRYIRTFFGRQKTFSR